MLKYKVKRRDLEDGVNLNLTSDNDVSLNMRQSEIYNSGYVDRIEEENVNQIIDYEKQMFTPMIFTKDMAYSPDYGFLDGSRLPTLYADGGGTITGKNIDEYLTPANSITFNLFFRERPFTIVTGYTINGNIISLYRDYDTWNSKDELYWNNIEVQENSGGDKLINSVKSGLMGDYLIHLGFDDDDVFYQKMALKKSFVRISIYDTPYRETQKLLHYSTIFFDTNKLYKKYIDACANKGRVTDDINENYVATNDNLTATFTCTNKYNNDASSDGFYLYLFDKVVSGNTCTELYMKVEFNNAKYGKTVPFIYPTDDYLNPIMQIPESQEVYSETKMDSGMLRRMLPINYNTTKIETDGVSSYEIISTNMKKVYEDMYIKIMVKFNYKTNSFVWFVPRIVQQSGTKKDERVSDLNGNIVFNLYEPRINN